MLKRSSLLAVCIVTLCCGSACNSTDNGHGTAQTDTSYHASADQPAGRGQELFRQRCQTCHGMTGDLQSNNAANLQHSVLDSISIVATIRNGRNSMPMFSHTFSDSDLGQLAVYVKTLRKQ